MTPAFQWITSGVETPVLDYERLEQWIVQVAASYNRFVRSLNYIFCSDDEIIDKTKFQEQYFETELITN